MVIPITGDVQPSNPIRPRRLRSRSNDEGAFEDLLVNRVEAADEGEQGSENRKSFWEKKGNPNYGGGAATEGREAARESQPGEAEVTDSLWGRKIDLRA